MVIIKYICDLCGQEAEGALNNLRIPKEIVCGIKGGTTNQKFPLPGFNNIGLYKELKIVNCVCCENCTQKIADFIKSIDFVTKE